MTALAAPPTAAERTLLRRRLAEGAQPGRERTANAGENELRRHAPLTLRDAAVEEKAASHARDG